MIFQSHCAGCDRVGPVLCRTCRFALARPSAMPRTGDVIAAVPFAGRPRDVLLGFKYGNRRQLAHHFAGLLVNRLIAEGLRPDQFDVVTWAPTSTRRRHRRGFDQAEVVARRVAAQLGVPCRRLLERAGAASPRPGATASTGCTAPCSGRRPRPLVVECWSSTTWSPPGRRSDPPTPRCARPAPARCSAPQSPRRQPSPSIAGARPVATRRRPRSRPSRS